MNKGKTFFGEECLSEDEISNNQKQQRLYFIFSCFKKLSGEKKYNLELTEIASIIDANISKNSIRGYNPIKVNIDEDNLFKILSEAYDSNLFTQILELQNEGIKDFISKIDEKEIEQLYKKLLFVKHSDKIKEEISETKEAIKNI